MNIYIEIHWMYMRVYFPSHPTPLFLELLPTCRAPHCTLLGDILKEFYNVVVKLLMQYSGQWKQMMIILLILLQIYNMTGAWNQSAILESIEMSNYYTHSPGNRSLWIQGHMHKWNRHQVYWCTCHTSHTHWRRWGVPRPSRYG